MNQTRMTSNPVLIVGGGIAGLSAAKRLKEKGIPVLVLEGRDRLGGRIHTVDLAGDQASWTDMGATFMDDHLTNRVYHVLNDAGAEFHPVHMRLFGQRFFDQRSSRWQGWGTAAWTMAKFGWRYSRLQAKSSKFATLGERIRALLGEKPRREDEFLLRFMPEMGIGGPLDETHPNVSAKNFWEYRNYEEKSSMMVTGGYRLLVNLMRKPLSESEVLLDQLVTHISVPQDASAKPSVIVKTSEGRTFEGSHVIVTVPLGVLKAGTITFDPPLPAAKQDVIQRIGFGNVEKTTMTFKNAFWRSDPQKPSNFFGVPETLAPHGMFIDVSAVAGSGPGKPASPCLAHVCGTDIAKWTVENPEEAVERIVSDLEKMFPDSFEPPVATATSTWGSDPFSRGAYAYPSVDTRPGDFATLGESTHGGMVLFAGDACAEGTFLGNVEAAMDSGDRAADAIVAVGADRDQPAKA